MKFSPEPFKHFWMSVYLRVLAFIYLFGAAMHMGNFMGMAGKPWLELPLSWRMVDIVYSIIDCGVVVGLWFRIPWGVSLFIIAALSQSLLYGVFPQLFAFTANQADDLATMVNFHLITLVVFFILGISKK